MKNSRRKAVLASICLIFILAFSSINSLAAPLPPGRYVNPFDPGWIQRQRGIDIQGFARRAPRPPSAPEAPEWDVSPWSKITFESLRDSTSEVDVRDEIYLVDGYGLNPTRLITDTLTDYFPRLNRGCTQIAFTSIRDGMDADIYLMNANGSGITPRTANSDWDSNAVWSPDGSQIAFMSDRDGGDFDIFVMNSDGSSPTNLTNNDVIEDGQPFWSPDGSQIAFASDRNGGFPFIYIFVMDANGANPQQVSTQPMSENPAWSPDGSRIAYDADGDMDTWQEVWVMDADGGNAQQLLDFEYDEEFNDWGNDGYVRSWSPDGRFIAFSAVYWEWVPNEQDYLWFLANIFAFDTTSSLNYSLGGVGADWDPDWQACDALPPSSAVQPLPVISETASFLVSWSGSDQTGAGQGLAGIKSYDLQVRDGAGGTWTDWLVGTTLTSQTYNGTDGHAYYFRSRARDNAFNVEAYPAGHDAYTLIGGEALFLPHVVR